MSDPVADLEEVLSMLRSAGEIAARKGANTNWPAFYAGVADVLARFNMRPVSPRTYRIVDPVKPEPGNN